MSNGAVITVENLSKRYVFAADRAMKLRELADGVLRRPRRRGRVTIDALTDVSFEVQRGEAFGVIGRNGAGKSTLLAILARVTTPTGGRATIRGQVDALLGIGAGFHPELTGRENIFVNAALLGFSSAKTKSLFDQIVDFSELSEFIDIPVKRYSSGMQARLGFAVAAYLDPDVLLLDEVLAVGDRAFKEKCHARVHEITRDGRTVLFVSHDMSSVLSTCERAVVLERGRVAFLGDTADATRVYTTIGGSVDSIDRNGTGEIRLGALTLNGSGGESVVEVHGPMNLTVKLETTDPVRSQGLRLRLGVHARRGVLGELNTQSANGLLDREIRNGDVLECAVARVPLKPGEYWLSARLERMGVLVDEIERFGSFWVVADGQDESLLPVEGDPGFMVLPQLWSVATTE